MTVRRAAVVTDEAALGPAPHAPWLQLLQTRCVIIQPAMNRSGRVSVVCRTGLLLLFFSLDLGFSLLSGVLGLLLKIWCFFDSGQILEIYVVLLYFPFQNTVVSQGQCAESVASTDEQD